MLASSNCCVTPEAESPEIVPGERLLFLLRPLLNVETRQVASLPGRKLAALDFYVTGCQLVAYILPYLARNAWQIATCSLTPVGPERPTGVTGFNQTPDCPGTQGFSPLCACIPTPSLRASPIALPQGQLNLVNS